MPLKELPFGNSRRESAFGEFGVVLVNPLRGFCWAALNYLSAILGWWVLKAFQAFLDSRVAGIDGVLVVGWGPPAGGWGGG